MFKQNKQRKSVKKEKLYWKEALDWGRTVTISLALTSEFEGHYDYLELFSSSLQLTHSLNSFMNSHSILSFLCLFRSVNWRLIPPGFDLMIRLLEPPKFIELAAQKLTKNITFSSMENWCCAVGPQSCSAIENFETAPRRCWRAPRC